MSDKLTVEQLDGCFYDSVPLELTREIVKRYNDYDGLTDMLAAAEGLLHIVVETHDAGRDVGELVEIIRSAMKRAHDEPDE